MPRYKVIATITWQQEGADYNPSLLEARSKLESILECEPYGDNFEGFGVQLDIAKMKERKKLEHLATYSVDDVFPHITEEDQKKEYEVDGVIHQVRMNSDRYFVFKENSACVSCGLEGTKMILDINPGDQSPHFNLYAEENGRLILMTKDHILAKSRGGKDELDNYQTMCSICNNLKGAYDISLENCRELRILHNNQEKLPRKELRDRINKRREDMAKGG